MNNPKSLRQVTPEELFNLAVEGEDLSAGALRLLTSGYLAFKEAYRSFSRQWASRNVLAPLHMGRCRHNP